MRKTLLTTLEEMNQEPYTSIICYPKSSKAEIGRRIRELQRLRVDTLEFCGEKEAFGIPVLGKGCSGIILAARRGSQKFALKVRRVDVDQSRMQREAEMLQKANSVGVGPNLIDITTNFLLMQFILGDLFPKWLEKQNEKTQIETVAHELLEQCWRLDEVGLDHGELSRATNHIIVSFENKPFLLDFQTASVQRRASNVTSMCQFLFIGSKVAGKIAEKLGKIEMKKVIAILKKYKNNKTRENFERVLKACDL